ncbi:MAG: M20/M25/M40 family metallo-hydrolase [Acidobacteriota bacterium]|nr:M20/M25/M40 family metallo-hydrolase [Acidobacteriota bacterium]
MKLTAAVLASTLLLPAASFPGQEPVDLDAVTRIREEGLRHSKVMEIASGLMDGVGPRLTGSPKMKEANDWTRRKLEEMGLSNAHLESWGPFGRGWSYEKASVRMLRPDSAQLLAIPEAWTPSTAGAVSGSAFHLKAASVEDLDQFKGKLAGKVVFFGDLREVKLHEKAESSRYDSKELEDLERYEIAAAPRFNREEFRKRRQLRRAVDKFLAQEKALAIVVPARSDAGVLGVQSAGAWRKSEPVSTLPDVVMAVEHYGRIVRLLDRKEEVAVELDIRTRITDEDQLQYDTIAEIPGTDKRGEVVMIGAHLDSWHAGTGATDNGAGVAATMEAMRILKAVGVHPKRTIRIGLWSGEEQGLLGSQAYVTSHFATRPTAQPGSPQDDFGAYNRPMTGPIGVKPEYAKLSAYFNLDNGTGKIRGIYAQENAAAVPIFESWIAPLKDLGVTAVTMRNTGSTDHVAFDIVGLPGFQFIQDEIEYETLTHHTNQDTYERLQREDLMQASVVIACFAYQAAMRDGLMPRKPLPTPAPKAEEATPEKGPLAKPAGDAAPPATPRPAGPPASGRPADNAAPTPTPRPSGTSAALAKG